MLKTLFLKVLKKEFFWKLNSNELDNTYYNKAIVDDERFLFVVAADLRWIVKKKKIPLNDVIIKKLKLIEEVSLRVFKERTTITSNGFIFQKGFWYRHRDYRFAGCETLDCLEGGVKRKKSISEDTSHSLRLPLFLESLKDGATDYRSKVYYKRLKINLLNQFLIHVVKQKSNFKCFKLTNYLDGSNGYFRFGYTTHKNTGYGPYELSETFKLGWWAFLKDSRINKLYARVSTNLKNQVPCELYYRDKTTRNRNPIITGRFENDLYTQITKMASEL